MRFQCPKCGYQGAVDALDAEGHVQCPACSVRLKATVVPPAPPSPVSPPPPGEAKTSLYLDPKFASPVVKPADGLPPAEKALLVAAQEAVDAATNKKGLGDELGHLIGKTLGGYQILRVLGAGGMGAVFLARQISLDREVALKVLPEHLAENPEALARFTREALSAAQLNHPNIVQVHDVGSAGGFQFISMEFVRGRSLGDMVRADGAVPLDVAAGYVLQVARGLKYAHERGIIHRDIKPDNLLLNELGVVKICDMGLAKMSGYFEKQLRKAESLDEWKHAAAHLTQASRGMGTPAYMAPEQSRDASTAGAAADQYALGCTLYYLCTGKPPYSGATALEVITKHRSEPLPPLEASVKNVSSLFSEMIQRMMRKNPEDRYPGMDEVIQALEVFLGIEGEKGASSAREKHLAALDEAYKTYYGKTLVKVRAGAGYGFAIATLAAFVMAIFDRSFTSAGEVLGLITLTPLLLFVLNGALTKAYLFRRVRRLFFGMGLKNWCLTVSGAILFLAILYLLGWLSAWGGCAVIALVLAAVFELGILRPLRKTRETSLDQVRRVLRDLRLHGLSEDALQDFVYRCLTGMDWEEFFEDLFGYEAMLRARAKWAAVEGQTSHRTFAVWRDPIAQWLDSIEMAWKMGQGKLILVRAEAKRLKASGLSQLEANKRAFQEADRFVHEQMESTSHANYPAAETALEKKERLQEMLSVPGRSIPHRRSPLWAKLDAGFHWAVLAMALLMIAGAWDNIPVLPPLSGVLPEWATSLFTTYRAWGFGGTSYAFVAGIALFITGMARGVGATVFVFAGSALLVFTTLLTKMVAQPQFTPQTAFMIGGALVVLGFALFLMRKFAQ